MPSLTKYLYNSCIVGGREIYFDGLKNVMFVIVGLYSLSSMAEEHEVLNSLVHMLSLTAMRSEPFDRGLIASLSENSAVNDQ